MTNAKLSTSAKLTHKIYGVSSKNAVFESLKKATIVHAIASHKNTIMIMPPPIDLPPKKTTGHKLFKVNCRIKIARADFTPGARNPLRQIVYAAIPIIVYKAIHTGPKTQSGGVKNGFLRFSYHIGIEYRVNNPPIIPAS